MRTSFSNFNILPQQIKYTKNNNTNPQKAPKSDVTFQGAKKEDASFYAAINIIPIIKNPAIYVQNCLVQDGFDRNEIEQWDIYSYEKPDEQGVKAYKKDYDKLMRKEGKTKYIFKSKKPSEDVMAMSRVYHNLKKNFVNEDTDEYAEVFHSLGRMIEDRFGTKIPDNKPVQGLILETLRHTNQYNEPVVNALLEDKNFNHINIPQAVEDIQTKESSNAALAALEAAQQTGYDKKLSLALSIMLSNASPKNLPVIKKALTEQEFLLTHKSFVTEKLASFLNECDFLGMSYTKNEALTLCDVDELMSMTECSDDSTDEPF